MHGKKSDFIDIQTFSPVCTSCIAFVYRNKMKQIAELTTFKVQLSDRQKLLDKNLSILKQALENFLNTSKDNFLVTSLLVFGEKTLLSDEKKSKIQ